MRHSGRVFTGSLVPGNLKLNGILETEEFESVKVYHRQRVSRVCRDERSGWRLAQAPGVPLARRFAEEVHRIVELQDRALGFVFDFKGEGSILRHTGGALFPL